MKRPPQWIGNLLSRLLAPRLYEAIIGDLDEKFNKRQASNVPGWKIKAQYILEGLGFLRMIRPGTYTNPADMCRNYLLVALRNVVKDRLYVLLNISGLALGMACFIVIFMYVEFERSYDRFHANADRIYRIPEEFNDDGAMVQSAMNHAPMGTIIGQNLPGFKNIVRIFPYSQFFNSFVTSTPDLTFKEGNYCFADSAFFRVFSFKSLTGRLDHALDAPYSVVLTRSTAVKYFGTFEAAVGKTLIFQNDERSFNYHVTAVIEDIPQASHFRFDFMASFSTLDQFMPWYNNWHHPSMFIYLEMETVADPDEMTAQIATIAKKHQPPYLLEEHRKYDVQQLTDIHLHSQLQNEWEPNSRHAYLRIYVSVGLFILVIACINFMNIATARSSGRSREVGMRKVLGGKRMQLLGQFLSEALVYSIISFVIAIGLAHLSLQLFFNNVIGKQISSLSYFSIQNLTWALAFIVVVAIAAGLYPAIFLSGFKPTQTLKGSLLGIGSGALRKGLVTFQFFISSLLISGTIIILRQVNYMKNKDLGFDEAHMISVRLSDRFAQQNYSVLKDALTAESRVSHAALSSTLPGRGDFHGFEIVPEGSTTGTSIGIKTMGADEDLLSTFNFQLLDGRDFSKNNPADQTAAFIINEAAARRLKWEKPVGKEVELTVYVNGAQKRKGTIIGLVKDFHYESMHHKIEPLLIYINKHPYYADYLTMKFKPGNVAESVELLQSQWKKFHPEKPIEYRFLDDELEKLYTSELKISRIFNVLAGISIFISCLGLFGLSAFLAEKRTKEVGIRKVMGASLRHIVQLQVKEFFCLILTANALMWPLAWWWSQKWLEGFAYHIKPNAAIFAVTLTVALLLVVATLSYHSLKAAMANPVKSLRHE